MVCASRLKRRMCRAGKEVAFDGLLAVSWEGPLGCVMGWTTFLWLESCCADSSKAGVYGGWMVIVLLICSAQRKK